MKKRCKWTGQDPLMQDYHDNEWGIALNDDKKWFEFLVLDTFQAGLSWRTILHKREGFRKCFYKFDVQKVAQIESLELEKLCQNKEIIRNRLKIKATISNAKAFIKIQQEFGSFNQYIWRFTNGKTIHNSFKELSEIPATTPLSDKMSKELKGKGFKFVGSTICYAFMQASGIVNDHTVDCFRYQQINKENNLLDAQ